jgi:tetratricopeptide (TPR) repeat protein
MHRIREATKPKSEGVIDAEQESAQTWFERGCALEEIDPVGARKAYRRAIERDVDHADAHINLGRILHEAGYPEAAQGHYRTALAVRPNDPTATFNLGVALEDTGRRAEAIEAYEASIALDPYNADAHYNLARLLEQTGRSDMAVRHLIAYRQLTKHR